jgi:hypothetical protein
MYVYALDGHGPGACASQHEIDSGGIVREVWSTAVLAADRAL